MSERIRCSDCEAVFVAAEIGEVNGCPSCGSKKVPQDPANDFDLRINTHDLRCLTIWADNFAHEKGFSSEPVLRRVRRALPEAHRALSLTLEDETKALADHLMDGTVTARAGSVELWRGGKRAFPAAPSDGDDRPSDRADLHDELRGLARAVVGEYMPHNQEIHEGEWQRCSLCVLSAYLNKEKS